MNRISGILNDAGAALMVLASLGGLIVSGFNYFNPDSGIAGEPGTLLVIASTILLAIFGIALARLRGGFLRVFFIVSSILNIAGTSFAGYLLHSQTLVILMFVSLLGWILHVFRRRRAFA
ncbi:MAG TPA: hypothetical protein VK602_08585 [Phyllobacterium sp.]|nr:hypothetical protein [Phyllobacterium sp.]